MDFFTELFTNIDDTVETFIDFFVRLFGTLIIADGYINPNFGVCNWILSDKTGKFATLHAETGGGFFIIYANDEWNRTDNIATFDEAVTAATAAHRASVEAAYTRTYGVAVV